MVEFLVLRCWSSAARHRSTLLIQSHACRTGWWTMHMSTTQALPLLPYTRYTVHITRAMCNGDYKQTNTTCIN